MVIDRYAEEIMKTWLSLQTEKHKGRIREDGKVNRLNQAVPLCDPGLLCVTE